MTDRERRAAALDEPLPCDCTADHDVIHKVTCSLWPQPVAEPTGDEPPTEPRARDDHDEWCDANGCRCGNCPCSCPERSL